MNKNLNLKRRDFLKSAAIGTVGISLTSPVNLLSKAKADEQIKVKNFRTYGKTGFKVSDIALGGITNVPVIKAMLDAGVNYIDTAESYSRGKSEIAMGQAIKGRNRKNIFINTKLKINETDKKEDIVKRFDQCLKRLDTPYIDSLMTHNPISLKMVSYSPFFEACDQLKKDKKLRFIGISSHGARSGKGEAMDTLLLAAVKNGRYDVILLVYNFIQKEIGEKIIKACQTKNIGVTLMKTNPVGRYLSMKERLETMEKETGQDQKRIERMKKYITDLKKSVTAGDWFIKKHKLSKPSEIRVASTRYALNFPGTHSLLARTDTFEDMEQFLKASGGSLNKEDKKKLAAYKKGFGKLYCRHACGICESSCPDNVPVNTIMRYNHYFESQRNEKYAMEKYALLNSSKADLCTSCNGQCQQKCPFGIPIQGLLSIAHENLSLA